MAIPPPPEALTAAAIAAPVVKEAMDGFGKTLAKQVGRVARSFVDRAVVDLQIGFQDYINTSYLRCKYFKTILNPNQPIEVAENYVHVTLTCGNSTISDDELIDRILSYGSTVVMGLAGSGKSMFMKYLTICRFENPNGAVPLFVELRHLNSMTDKDLITYIRTSCASKKSNITAEQFDLSLQAGAMLLILDGFDELHHEIRDDIQSQILAIKKDYPETKIVISSRPDGRFGSWSSFHIFTVDKLSKKQTISLINGLDYDSGVKRRFSKEVNIRLYITHESFLSSPLLTTIMLLAYEGFAEIPDRMHSFYSQAFDTLFQKHDAQKEQYQRKTHTGLGRDDFKDCFSAFSAMSYLEQNFSFDDDELAATAESAIKYTKQSKKGFPASVTPKQLVDDLRESVCMLQQDGIETAFVHRSFQEYFAAVFATRLHSEKVAKVLDRYSLRFGDSVLAMALDMAREVVEREWVVPTTIKLEQELKLDSRISLTETMSKLVGTLSLHGGTRMLFPTMMDLKTENLGPLETICRLYPKQLGGALFIEGFQKHPESFDQRLFSDEFRGRPLYDFFQELKEARGDKAPFVDVDFNQDNDWWLEILGARRNFSKIKTGFSAIRKDIQSRDEKRTTILGDFL